MHLDLLQIYNLLINSSWSTWQIIVSYSKIEQSHDLIELFCTCKILEVLKLKWGFVFKIPASRVCFPSLKYLHVDTYWPSYSCFTERLFTICPMLEDMSTNIHLGDHTKPFNLNISSPALKRLTLLEKEFHANYQWQDLGLIIMIWELFFQKLLMLERGSKACHVEFL